MNYCDCRSMLACFAAASARRKRFYALVPTVSPVCSTPCSMSNTALTEKYPSHPATPIPLRRHLPTSFADVSIHSETGLQSRYCQLTLVEPIFIEPGFD